MEIIDNQLSLKEDIEKNEKHIKSIIKGAFLGAGSISDPQKEYHLEVEISNQINQKSIIELLKELNIKVKDMEIQNKFYIYIKEGEEISKFLASIGANKAIMKFEDIRVQKDMRGKVNRLVNCETANLTKTINASIQQISAIEKLKKLGKFNRLDDNLKEIANLRVENPDVSLLELGKLLKKPIGKSGVNYRLKKIIVISDENNN